MKSSTYKIVAGIAGLIVGITIVSLLYSGYRSASATPNTLEEVYPLFSSGISWSSQESVSLPPMSDYNPATSTITGYEVISLPTASTQNIGAVVEPLRNYYDQLLVKNGWKINTKFEADGAGGSLWGFTKGNQVLIFSYTSTFMDQQPNTPEQCPCTVVFTIIGGTLS